MYNYCSSVKDSTKNTCFITIFTDDIPHYNNSMRYCSILLTAALSIALASSCASNSDKQEAKIADSPLFIDPVYNGSTDPMVCYNPNTRTYFMYYTSRRSNVEGLNGIESIHGSPIGIAESRDGGASWTYIGDANIDYASDQNPTYWAPEVIYHEGRFLRDI